jgi:two-component system nitrate/nitrite sensor histidine kinase NarX
MPKSSISPSERFDWAALEERRVIEFPWLARIILLSLFIVFMVIGAVYFGAVNTAVQQPWVSPAVTALWLVAGFGVLALLYWMWREFERFGQELSYWALRLRKGDLTIRMPIRGKTCPSRKIREQINAITDDYQAMSRIQQQRLSKQAKDIKQKNQHLSVLYDVAASINRASNLEDLLNCFLKTVQRVVEAEAATVRLVDSDNNMRLVASIGLQTDFLKCAASMPADQCLCLKSASTTKITLCTKNAKCGQLLDTAFMASADIEVLAIPLQYRERVLGVYNLFLEKSKQTKLENEAELLISIGQHLGMAIEKASLDEDARTLSIMEERTRMAHELHDSLAQTLASLRFKVRLFDDSLNRGEESTIWQELEGLEHTIDEAYAELRSLITHFRAPLDGKGIIRVVERLAERFRQETKIDVFYYHNWHLKDLPSEVELEVIRIIQEALANVRKHSHAQTVRILLYSSEEGKCSILVEDDGIGLPIHLPEPDPKTGEHIGLTVMRARAERVCGDLQFESEPGEGTLIHLNFAVLPTKKLSDLVKRTSIYSTTSLASDTP